jgi:hypothetical protein
VRGLLNSTVASAPAAAPLRPTSAAARVLALASRIGGAAAAVAAARVQADAAAEVAAQHQQLAQASFDAHSEVSRVDKRARERESERASARGKGLVLWPFDDRHTETESTMRGVVAALRHWFFFLLLRLDWGGAWARCYFYPFFFCAA